jgi:K+-sensing histidine kinase KdpD
MGGFRDDAQKCELFCQELSERSWLVRYGVATLLVLLAFAGRLLLNPVVHQRSPLTFFLTSAIVAALFGRFGPGLYALILGFLLADYFFLPPLGSLFMYGNAEWIAVVGTFIPGLMAIIAIALLHRARRKLKAHAKELNSAKEQLEKSVCERTAELEAFCYSVSHDLRAPLRRIGSFAQIINEEHREQFNEESREMQEAVIESANCMNRIIEDLLKLSRLSRGEMQRRCIDLSALVQGIAAGIQKHEPQRVAEFVIAPNLVAHGDEQLLRVALENLLHNAWKFTGRCSRSRIEFGIERDEGQLAYFIRDNGVGFDMAHATKIFGVFERLHSEAEFPGTGIGLAIVQRVINRHGGKIWAKGVPEKGATFYFTLPDQARGVNKLLQASPHVIR